MSLESTSEGVPRARKRILPRHENISSESKKCQKSGKNLIFSRQPFWTIKLWEKLQQSNTSRISLCTFQMQEEHFRCDKFLEKYPRKKSFIFWLKNRIKYHGFFFKQFHMTLEKLKNLLAMAAPRIMRTSLGREANRPREKLCFTLHYLVSGDSRVMIAARYRISPVTINSNFNKTCLEIRNSLLQKKLYSTARGTRRLEKTYRWFFLDLQFPRLHWFLWWKTHRDPGFFEYYSYT